MSNFKKKNFSFNKRAQVAPTATWFIATLVIIAILIVSVILSLAIAKLKNITGEQTENVETGFSYDSLVLTKKTELALKLNNANKEKILEILMGAND